MAPKRTRAELRRAGFYVRHLQSPWGTWEARATRRGLFELSPCWTHRPLRHGARMERASGVPRSITQWFFILRRALTAYLRSGRPQWKGIPLDLSGHSAFDRAVYRRVADIPAGRVRSYAWVAKRVGRARAFRACAQALSRNRLPLLIPCHRVVASDGSLGGYSWGKSWKEKLIALEGSRASHAF